MDTQNTQLKFIGYCRKSSEDNKERQAASLPDQLYILEGIKAKHGLNIIKIFQESRSAHKPNQRDEFKKMVGLIEEGTANAILTWHANRLSRNPVDGGYIIYLMDEGKLLEIRTPSRSYRNTSEDKFMLSLEFSISKKDSDDKAIVVERGLEKKCRDGWRPGVAPQGYLNDKATECGLRKIFTDRERFPFMKKMFELFHDGTSVKEIHRLAKEVWHYHTIQRKRSGGGYLSLGMIYANLTNPFYCGKFEYPVGSGNWYDGQHEKAVTEEIFNEIQVKLGRRSQYHLKNHEWPYSALMTCDRCKGRIVPEEKWQCICPHCKLKFSLTRKNKDHCPRCQMTIETMSKDRILHYVHYRCKHRKDLNCREKGIRVEELERQVDEKLSQIEISPLFMDWALRQIQKMNEDERGFREDTIETIKRSHDECRRKLDNLLQLKISSGNTDGGLLSDAEYKSLKIVLENELKDLEKQLGMIDNRMIQAQDDTVKAFTFATRARERFATCDNKTKREIFMALGSHLTLLDRKVQFDAPEYLYALKKMKEEVPEIAKAVAPNIQSLTSTKTDASFASVPTLLRGRESHPAWEIMLNVISNYLECRTISSPEQIL